MIAKRHGVYANTNMSNEWAVFFELRNGTGFGRQSRYADAFALHLWPSQGHRRVAYEIKVSRSDFMHELENPDKRQWAWGISNEFWFACAPGVARPDEVPASCGLLEARGDKLVRKVVAQQREAADLTINELAALARQCSPTEIFRSLRWRYAGKDMTEEQLAELIASEKPAAEAAEFERRVKEAVDERVSKITESLATYAAELESAGVEPPDFMKRPLSISRGSQTLSAKRWVEQWVSPGPNLSDIEAAIRTLEYSERQYSSALKTLRGLRERKSTHNADESVEAIEKGAQQ